MNRVSIVLAIFTIISLTALISYSRTNTDVEESSFESQFALFLQQNNRNYSSINEYTYRLRVFTENARIVNSHNSDSYRTFTAVLNNFADMTLPELKLYYTSNFQHTRHLTVHCPLAESLLFTADKIDWNSKGNVFAVKDQKKCGSCWAFSATAALESAFSIQKNESPIDISEQELVDCSTSYGNKGCQGGFMDLAYNYILDHKINLSKDYPYTGRNNKCNTQKSGKGNLQMKGCFKQRPDVDGLVEALNVGPVAVGVFADILMFFYESGIFNIPQKLCDSEVDHGVLAVGYDKTGPVPYFIVKNSWSAKWGDNGYFKIAMGDGAGLCRMSGNGNNFYPIV